MGDFVSAHVNRAERGPDAKRRLFELLDGPGEPCDQHDNGGKGKEAAVAVMGNVTFDLSGCACEAVECLYLYTDSAGYPIFLALARFLKGDGQKRAQETGDKNERTLYRRVGMGSMRRVGMGSGRRVVVGSMRRAGMESMRRAGMDNMRRDRRDELACS